MSGLRTHGGAIDVVADADYEKDVPVYIDGFHGFTLDRVEEGDTVAIDVSGGVWEFEIPAGVAAPIGTTLYISTDGENEITAEADDNVPFAKVVLAKDANNIVWAKQLPQVAAPEPEAES